MDHSSLQTFTKLRLDALGINQFEAARRGELERGFVRDILIGRKTTVLGRNLVKLAAALETTPEEIARVMEGDARTAEARSPQVRAPVRIAGPPLAPPALSSTSSRDIPVHGTRTLGPIRIEGLGGALEGAAIDRSRAVGYLPRTPGLADNADLYAIRIPGPSMQPALEVADLRVIDPHRPARTRDIVVVLLGSDGDGRDRAVLGFLAGETERGVMIEQIRPQAVHEIPRPAIAAMHRVVSYSELFTG